jgi:hypothetical protein
MQSKFWAAPMEAAMPLVPADDEPTVVNGNVQFVMCDGTKRVTCIVSAEALNDLEGRRAETDLDKIDRYNFARDTIHQAASDKYDAGMNLPIVTSADLV